jgi:hypothetical protein
MATVLIFATDQMIGGLLGQLTDLAGHAAQFGHASQEPNESVRETRPDVVLLDADYGPTASDAITTAAREVGASLIYFGTTLSALELRRLALARGAKYFPLPAGPKLLGRVLASALAADDTVGMEDSDSSAHSAIVAAVSAVARARMLAERAAALKTLSQALRGEHEALLADCRRSAAELREAIIAYTRELRAAGVPADQALARVKDVLRAEVTRSGAAPSLGRELEDATEWCLQAYYAA